MKYVVEKLYNIHMMIRLHLQESAMVNNYIELDICGQGEVVEKKSRFIAYVHKVETEEEAYEFVESIKKKNYDARHNCFAFSVGVDMPLHRFSDDGEPQGTAGKPILEVIIGSDIKNICIVVTRYFGGTLLGTGGLLRAYTDAAKEGINNSTVVNKMYVNRLLIETDYNGMGKLQYILNNENIPMEDTEYTDKVIMKALVPIDKVPYIKKLIIEATSARANIVKDEEFYYCCNLDKSL